MGDQMGFLLGLGVGFGWAMLATVSALLMSDVKDPAAWAGAVFIGLAIIGTGGTALAMRDRFRARPRLRDIALFTLMVFAAAFEALLITQALLESGDATTLAREFQWTATVMVGGVGATLVYFSAMSKTWQDRDERAAERNGITDVINMQFLTAAYFALDIYERTIRNAHHLINVPFARDILVKDVGQVIELCDAALAGFRERAHLSAGARFGELIEKSVSLTALGKDLKMIAAMVPALANEGPFEEKLRGIHIIAARLYDKIIYLTSKYPNDPLTAWHKEFETALELRAKLDAEFFPELDATRADQDKQPSNGMP